MSARLLIADDDPVYLALGAEELEAAGYSVATVDNGIDAFDLLEMGEFDLMITDLEMPRLDGLSLVQRVRNFKDEGRAMMPIIMATGREDTAAINRAYDCGATSFIQKPVNWVMIQHHVSFVLRAYRASIALREARDMALKASRGKDSLMMALRHELRSPLHVIQGFSSILRNKSPENLDPDAISALHYIEDGVDELIDKMDKLFMYSEILNRTLSITVDEVDPLELLRRAKNRVLEESKGGASDILIRCDVGSRVHLNADQEKLFVAFTHLLDNAAKFSPQGGLVRVTLGIENDGFLEIVIDDEGDGFDLTRVEDYVAGFVQGDEGLTRSSTGIGLGLTVANYIAQAHGGSMQISNNEKGGGRVSLVFPLQAAMPRALLEYSAS